MNNQTLKLMVPLALCLLSCACGGDSGGGQANGSNGPDAPPPDLGPAQAATTEGTLQGSLEGDLVVFRGVRYAASPTGELRFKAPQPPPTFAGVREALEFGPACVQPSGAATVGEEDCLFLNIWSHNDDIVRPVMVYLHPGAANGVSGAMTSIDGADLAAVRDVVVVNFNRRLGVLGFLAIDELIQENPQVTAGNYGLLDVVAALEWVAANAAAFNADPDRVIVVGTSAGGLMTCHLLGVTGAAGLVDAVSVQSAPCNPRGQSGLNAQSPVDSRFPPAAESHRDLLAAVGCDTAGDVLACLRALPAADLTLAGAALSDGSGRAGGLFGPIVDGVIVSADVHTALEEQTLGDIPLIIGMAQRESDGPFGQTPIPDDDAYRARLAAMFQDPLDDQLYALYPTASYPTAKDAFLELMGDVVFSCNAELMAQAAGTGAPAYLYEITRGFDSGGFAGLGAVHAIDIPYLFGSFDVYGYEPDAQALTIRDAMRVAWSSLARDPTATPPISGDGASVWPVYDEASASYVEFGETVEGKGGHRNGRCAAVLTVLQN